MSYTWERPLKYLSQKSIVLEEDPWIWSKPQGFKEVQSPMMQLMLI